MKLQIAAVAACAAVAALLPAPANAAPILECWPVHGAPAMRDLGGGGRARVYYYHQCNVDPAAAGVTNMYEWIGIRYDSGHERKNEIGQVRQQSAAYHQDWVVGTTGYYTPVNELRIAGTFTFGSAPGCSRNHDHLVVCRWTGDRKYITGNGASVNADTDAVALPAVPLADSPIGM